MCTNNFQYIDSWRNRTICISKPTIRFNNYHILLCIFCICMLMPKCILSENFQNQLEKIWHFILKYFQHASLKNQDILHVIWTIIIPKKIIKSHIFIQIPPVISLLYFVTGFCFSFVSFFFFFLKSKDLKNQILIFFFFFNFILFLNFT